MFELVEKFFKEDLTDLEDQVLSDILLSSEEEALRFGDLGRKAYRRFGLPEPDWKGPVPNPFRRPSRWGRWLGPLVFLSGSIAFAATGYHFRHALTRWPIFEPFAPKPIAAPAPEIITRPTPVSQPSPVARVSPASKSALLPNAAPVVARVTPVQKDSAVPAAFSNLSVEVQQSKDDFILVRLLDNHGAEIGVLYQGKLKSGDWVFHWNGKLLNGSPAPSGFYQIEVQSDGFHQSKTIEIQ
jgi:hypothetical protein